MKSILLIALFSLFAGIGCSNQASFGVAGNPLVSSAAASVTPSGSKTPSASQPAPTPSAPPAPPQATPAPTPQTPTSADNPLYNFVAGDETTCETSIYQRFGFVVRCEIGGGCSLDGHVPSASDPSANPGLWGACITGEPPAQQHTTTMYNFVAGDEMTCQTSIYQRLGLHASCSIGGGCALDGQMPSSSDPSANPGLWGACIAH